MCLSLAARRGTVPLLLLLTLGACGKKQEQTGQRPAPPVTVANVQMANIPIDVSAIGNVEAFSSVAVKAQVAGQLQRVYFSEGQDVKAGQLLFLIDPRTYQEQVSQAQAAIAKSVALEKQAEAQLARDEAQLATARIQAQRYADLAAKGVVSREQNEQYRTTAEALAQTVEADRANIESAKATIRSDEASLANARLQLGYTRITAPINGRTGALTVKEGNLIQANAADPLVTINQVSPIYVSFSLPEQVLPDLKRYAVNNKLSVSATPSDAVQARSTGSTLPAMSQGQPPKFQAQGTLSFVDNTVDTTTGTIRLKATFRNEDRQLWPGQFARVSINLSTQNNALLIPQQAIQSGQKGNYVYVIKPDMTAEQRIVVTSRQIGDQAVIERGLKQGERVVTDGQIRVIPGSKVQIGGGQQTQAENTSSATPAMP